jgi:hypothetical protein
MARHGGSWLALGIVLALGCSGSEAEQLRDGHNWSGAGGGVTSTGGAGGTSGAGGLDIDMPGAPMSFGGGGGGGEAGTMSSGECQVGVFCPPSTPDGDECGTLRLEGEVSKVPGNVLLVFDRSFSMEMDWNGMLRYQAAGTAMIDALTPLAADLNIGMIGFPSPDPAAVRLNCTVLGIDSPDQITFKPGMDALNELRAGGAGGIPKYDPIGPAGGAIGGPLGGGPLGGGEVPGATPTAEAIAMADQALNSVMLTGNTAVVLITDGEPNCLWDEAAANATIARWLSEKNIKTYVVGLPGVTGVGGPILDALAASGGTAPYLTPTNSMELATKVTEIISSTVGFNSCTITLNPKAELADKLQMVVEEPTVMGQQEVPRDLGNGAGWSITSDGQTVELLGKVCEDAKGGRFTALTFQYGCTDLPPIEWEAPE